MRILGSRKDKNTQRRPGSNSDIKRMSYHYSSKRSYSEKNLGRRVEVEGDSRLSDSPRLLSLKNIPSIASVLMVLIGFIYLLTLSTNAQIIVNNKTESSQKIVNDILQKDIDEVLSSSLLSRFKLTIKSDELSKKILEKSPEISSAEIQVRMLKHRPEVIVNISTPSLIITNGSSQYVVGDDGRIISDLSSAKGAYHIDALPVIQDETGIGLDIGKQALSAQQVNYISNIKYQFLAKNLNITSYSITSGGAELDIKLKEVTYLIKLNLFEDARKSSGVVLATMDRINKDSVTPSEYLDARVPERAYIK